MTKISREEVWLRAVEAVILSPNQRKEELVDKYADKVLEHFDKRFNKTLLDGTILERKEPWGWGWGKQKRRF